MKRIPTLILSFSVGAALLVAAPALAQVKSLSPGVNKGYKKPNVEKTAKSYERETRAVVKHREAILEACRLKPGMVVADIGAGTGLFTRPMARAVAPDGKALAVDIVPDFVDHIQKTAEEAGLDNLECVLSTPTSTELPPKSIDLAFICDTYHHFEFPYRMLSSIRRALKPGGRLVIVDYKKEKGVSPDWVMGHVRADRQTVVDEVTRAGFRLIDSPDFMETQYLVHFEKTDAPEPPLEGDYFLLRGELDNCRIRFAREKRGRVAFLGGSITVARGWRPQVCQWLEERFPETEFDFVNAGISSTDTALGPFRLQDTVFSDGAVDLLFVEFAVNDRCNFRTPTESLRGMEGIVRQARKTNPKIDIVMMHFVDEEKMALLRQGKTPPEIVAHEKVADHYRVTSIDLAREVTDRIDRGEFDWQRFGGLHPSAFGHALYADTIARMFETAWDEPLAEDAKPKDHKLPEEPLDPFHYGRGRFVSPEAAQVAGGWQLDPSWQASDNAATRREFTGVPMLLAKQPGAELTLEFEGTAVGLLIVAGPDVGVLEYQVDDGPKRTVDQFTPWSDRLHIPWALMLETELAPGEHVLTLRTDSDKNEKSTGHAARIVKFLVN